MASLDSQHNTQSPSINEKNTQQKNDEKKVINEINSLKMELHLWIHAYYEIVNLFKNIIPISEDTAKNSLDKQNTLLKICRDVAKASNCPQPPPINPPEKSPVIKKKLKKKNNIKKENLQIKQLEESQMTVRLQNIDSILTKEIKKNKRYLPRNNFGNPPNSFKKSTSSPRVKESTIFPSYSQLLSPDFHDKSIQQFTPTISDKANVNKTNNLQIELNKTPIKYFPSDSNLANDSTPDSSHKNRIKYSYE